MVRIGVLALQGDFAKHVEVLRSLGAEVIEVRTAEDLVSCDGLIIPGGESTVMMRLIDFIDLRKPLLKFASQKPVFGTCAGLILMAKEIKESSMKPFELLDITLERNAYGRQIESFQSFISLELKKGHIKTFPAFFIRAPRIKACGKNVQILARLNTEPILVQEGHHLGSTFHPELTADPQIHRYFIEMIKNSSS